MTAGQSAGNREQRRLHDAVVFEAGATFHAQRDRGRLEKSYLLVPELPW
jgi:hypothetical protein